MKVSDLINPVTGLWDKEKISQLVLNEDLTFILHIKPSLSKGDSTTWCLSKDGDYSSKSSYRFLEGLKEMKIGQRQVIPLIEKSLWLRLWKVKTSPKIRHFLWKALAGALAVKERLQTRGIPVDSACSSCNLMLPESIGHVLFNCSKAKETWDMAQIPLPPSGFSQNSVFLNIHIF